MMDEEHKICFNDILHYYPVRWTLPTITLHQKNHYHFGPLLSSPSSTERRCLCVYI